MGSTIGLTHARGVADDDGSIEADPGGVVGGDRVQYLVVGVETGGMGELKALAVPDEGGKTAGFTGPTEVDSVEVHTLLDDRTCDSL